MYCCSYLHRYGREDEEVMGLKFCNEAIITLQQIWPKTELEPSLELSNLQVNYMSVTILKVNKTFTFSTGSTS